jgi:uncharacterized protein involved in exopolysaccharide biosynthesis/Mrp family chromosome partitioning ATPase
MNTRPTPAENPGLNLSDVYYVIFRHKWKILTCAVAGVIGAIAAYRMDPPPYQSAAKLYIRYVLTESKTVATMEGAAKSPDQRGETIMNSEMEILTSSDLAQNVAQALGPERLLAKIDGEKSLGRAADMIQRNLVVNTSSGSSVIHISFKHPDPEIVQPVLQAVVSQYLKKHVDTHRTAGMLGETLAQEADTLRSQLVQMEDDLRKAKNKAGVISLDESKRMNAANIATVRREIFEAQAELAERDAVFKHLTKQADSPLTSSGKAPEAPLPAINEEYTSISQRLMFLQKLESELLAQFRPENPRVKDVQLQISEVTEVKRKLETDHPQLVPARITGPTSQEILGPRYLDADTTAAQITALRAKLEILGSQLADLQNEAARIDQMEGTILDLQRKKELLDVTYRYYASTLEQNRINESLGNGNIQNIVEIQQPSPPFVDTAKAKKRSMVIGVGGFLIGLAWAFLIEVFLDRSLRRPGDITKYLDTPLFLSIPRLKTGGGRGHGGSLRLLSGASRAVGSTGASNTLSGTGPEEAAEVSLLNPFHDTLRDRLISYFESMSLQHKPKLIAITALARSSGVTTTAMGLARSLSETGEGNVLLVDMTAGQGAAHQFIKGQQVCGIDDALDARTQAQVDNNLFVVAENTNSDLLSRNLPQRFAKLIPKLKSSDFDYIIFDMPPVNQLSITPRLAGFMDMVLMVIESEKSDRDLAHQASSLLSAKTRVGVVLNKAKSYVPARLDSELLHS